MLSGSFDAVQILLDTGPPGAHREVDALEPCRASCRMTSSDGRSPSGNEGLGQHGRVGGTWFHCPPRGDHSSHSLTRRPRPPRPSPGSGRAHSSVVERVRVQVRNIAASHGVSTSFAMEPATGVGAAKPRPRSLVTTERRGGSSESRLRLPPRSLHRHRPVPPGRGQNGSLSLFPIVAAGC